MTKQRTKLPTRFSRQKIDRLRSLRHAAHDAVEKRQNNIHHRNQLLASTQAYNLGLEKTRMQSHLTSRPNALQRAATEEYMGTLTRQIHHLAKTGLP